MSRPLSKEDRTMKKPQDKYNDKTYSVLSIRVPKEKLTKFKAKCKSEGQSQMSLINDFITEYLN